MSSASASSDQSASAPPSAAAEALLSALSALLSAELRSSSSQYELLTECNNIAAGKARQQPHCAAFRSIHALYLPGCSLRATPELAFAARLFASVPPHRY